MNISNIISQDTQGFHNFSLGCLDAYFDLSGQLRAGKVKLVEDVGFYLKRKVFIFSQPKDIREVERFRKSSVIYSAVPLDLPGEKRFSETVYNLAKVFDPSSYKNAKKRHQRIKYPFKWCKDNGYEVALFPTDAEDNGTNYEVVKTLHDEWVQKKVDDPKTYKIMFPQKRYIRCFEKATEVGEFVEVPTPDGFGLATRDPFKADYIAFGIISGDCEVVAVRVVSIDSWRRAYDLAFFSKFWDLPSQATNYFNVVLLDALRQEEIGSLNCGAELNKNLRVFKHHLPHETVQFYMYSKRSDK